MFTARKEGRRLGDSVDTFAHLPVPSDGVFHSLRRGETLTYGTRESLTYGIGVSQTDFEAVKGEYEWLIR